MNVFFLLQKTNEITLKTGVSRAPKKLEKAQIFYSVLLVKNY